MNVVFNQNILSNMHINSNIPERKEDRAIVQDTLIMQKFKENHAQAFQELMGYEADKSLFNAGCLKSEIFDDIGTES